MKQCLPVVRHLVSIATVVVLLVSCTGSDENKSSGAKVLDLNAKAALTTANNNHQQTTTAILAQAEQKYEEAKELEHAWKATRVQIEIAHRAIKDNDEERARVAATRALYTANASVKQAVRGREDWLTHVVK
jgi:hypothetical protein